MIRAAEISPDGRYRYSLDRRWEDGPKVTWVMLNPSTADADVDDPTLRRCIAFSQAHGFGALEVVNLFALRSSDPAALLTADDPVGPDNDRALDRAAFADRLVYGWGAWLTNLPRRDRARLPAMDYAMEDRLLWFNSTPPLCLGRTRAGAPRHPLYLPHHTRFEPWLE